MRSAALAARMHSGWGALVVVAAGEGKIEVIERRRLAATAPGVPGVNQPYHFAKTLDLSEAEDFVRCCFATSERLVASAVRGLVDELRIRNYHVIGSGVVLASGHVLPPFSKILASHALIHTAEGEFFRKAFRNGCESLDLPVTGFPERNLEDIARAAFGSDSTRLLREIYSLGRSLGPPWTKDQKTTALAASILLVGKHR